MNTPPLPSGLPPATSGSSNKKWILFGGCGCLGLLLLGLAFAGALFLGVTKVIKSTGPYQTALASAKESPEVQAELGTPIEEGFMPSGNVNVTNDTGEANLTFSIKGPKGSGTVHYRASRSRGEWHTQENTVTIEESGKVIDLGH
jgi:hypothetical protein